MNVHPSPWLGNSRTLRDPRTSFLAAALSWPAGAAAWRWRRHRRRAARRRSARSERRSLSGEAQREIPLDRPSPTRRSTQLQQFLRVRPEERRAATALAAPVDGQDRRHGREAAGDRHRRSLAQMPLEERLYRHRCVEAWSMAIPWSGFPLAKLVDGEPLPSAKYCSMETFLDNAMAPEQRQSYFPWPYTEGLTMAEATNELAFLVTGAYGKPVAKQMVRRAARGAVEVRIQIDQVDRPTSPSRRKRPKTIAEAVVLAIGEYGFVRGRPTSNPRVHGRAEALRRRHGAATSRTAGRRGNLVLLGGNGSSHVAIAQRERSTAAIRSASRPSPVGVSTRRL